MHPSFRPVPKTQRPDREETGRANESMIAAAARRCRQRSGFMFIGQLAYPTVADSLSTHLGSVVATSICQVNSNVKMSG